MSGLYADHEWALGQEKTAPRTQRKRREKPHAFSNAQILVEALGDLGEACLRGHTQCCANLAGQIGGVEGVEVQIFDTTFDQFRA